ncbi:MAG: S8 family serine peptidase [Chlorobi bacterium]|nr:S8 family serine peptidase [Chlorobiota bacterium]
MKKLLLLSAILLGFLIQAFAQTETNVEELMRLSKLFKEQWEANRQEVINYSQQNNVPIRTEDSIVTREMQYIDQFGKPEYYQTENKNAAATISTNKVHTGGGAGLTLDGSGMTVHEWDAAAPLTTHQEFGSRITIGDGTSTTHYHSTHVAGTLIASGVDPYAKGMAPLGNLRAFDWNSDNAEMASEAAAGALVSNHSYGYTRGWAYNSTDGNWYWYGSVSVSTTEDYLFGFYDQSASDWDDIAYNAPYYLICKSAGNDRGDYHSGGHYYWNGSSWVYSTAARDADGGSTGYDCVGSQATAKNILTVGAVDDIPGGYIQPSDVVMSSFSGWGPADDGRIKPDIVANGVSLWSTMDGSNTDYASLSGTSMASPNAAGSLILLQEHWEDLNGAGSKMRSATLKALIIHTADEAGSSTGPDYKFGWGLINIEKAAKKITEDLTNDVISEHVLNNGGSYTTTITATSGYPIKVTICWTDPKGTPPAASLDPADVMLVNDLNLKLEDQSATVYYPWKLDKNNPSAAATNSGQNTVDNVEMVYIANPTPGEIYTITVDHNGTLSGGSQAFSMIISGYPVAPSANFYADKRTCGLNETVSFTDVSTENPTSWTWSMSPSDYVFVGGTSASSQNPQVQFTKSGSYDVTLYVSNSAGNDTEVKTSYIVASDAPAGYCYGYSTNPYGYIDNFSFAGIENYHTGYTNVASPDPNDEYYQDFTNIMINVNLLQTYTLYVLNGSSDVNNDLGVWIDFNRDGDFADAGENVVCDVDSYGQGTFSVAIPADASIGATRMRLRTKYWNSDCGSPCGSTANGEVEDYTINILVGTLTWTGAVSSDWNNAGNWDGGIVPNANYDVVIPDASTVPNSPVIYSAVIATCANLTLETNANLSCDGELNLMGTP